MCTGLDPLSVQDGGLCRRNRDDQIALGDGFARGGDGMSRDPQLGLDLTGERGGLHRIDVVDPDFGQRPDLPERGHLIPGLHTGANHTEHVRVGSREMARGHTSRRTRADPSELIAGDHGAQRSVVAAEEKNHKVGFPDGSTTRKPGECLETEETQIGDDGAHHAKGAGSARQIGTDPRHRYSTSRRVLGECLFYQPDTIGDR